MIHENVPPFNAKFISKVLGPTHRVYTMIMSPKILAYPLDRKRRITVAVRKDWVLTLPLENVLTTMARRLVMQPGDLWCLEQFLTKDTLDRYMLAEKKSILQQSPARGLNTGGEVPKAWKQLLLPSQLERLNRFNDETKPFLASKGSLDLGMPIIVGIDQNPSKRVRATHDVVGASLNCIRLQGTIGCKANF